MTNPARGTRLWISRKTVGLRIGRFEISIYVYGRPILPKR